MKNTLLKSVVAAFSGLLLFSPLAAAEKTLAWTMPSDWDRDVRYERVGAFVRIVSDSLDSPTGEWAPGSPDLPRRRVKIDMPHPGTFLSFSQEAEWEAVDLDGAQVFPVLPATVVGETSPFPELLPAYDEVFPASPVEPRGFAVERKARKAVFMVSPFRWDGTTKTLYRAKALRLSVTFEVPDAPVKSPARAVADTCRAAAFGNDHTADVVILSPSKFVDLWTRYADFRQNETEAGKEHTFAVKSTADIYEEYDGHDDALKIHHYLEHLYADGNIKYVILGAANDKASYDRATMIPSRKVVVGYQADAQILDEYYGCMEKLPVNASGEETGKEVWDYTGDGIYMGRKYGSGVIYDYFSYSSSQYKPEIDWTLEIAVSRMPLMDEMVEELRVSENYGNTYRVDDSVVLTAEQMMTNIIEKTRRFEAGDFAGRFGAALVGSVGNATSSWGMPSRSENYGPIVNERGFFDGGLNIFDLAHSRTSVDSEFSPRDRNWEFLTYLRGMDVGKIELNSNSYAKRSAAEMRNADGDILNVVSHGWARGADPLSVTSLMFSTEGLQGIYCCPIPCDAGQMDYCVKGSYGITNTISVGEAAILAPKGGALASYFNTRNGYSATYATSDNKGNGDYSFRMEYWLFQALSGLAKDDDGNLLPPMNAGDALTYAKNRYGGNPITLPGLAGAQVTCWGDPLVKMTPQVARTWRANASSSAWSRSDANWTAAGSSDPVALDFSTDLYVDRTGKGSVAFSVDGSFASAGLFVAQDEGATMTLSGDGDYRAMRETVVTNGHVRWEVAGGAGRNGLSFVGARGDLLLPGDKTRYFGDRFSNVGEILVSGANVTIDTPLNASYGAGGSVDVAALSFVGEGQDVSTNNVFRARTRHLFPETFTMKAVGTRLALEAVDSPALAATNAVLTLCHNPLFTASEISQPLTLHDAVLTNATSKGVLGSEDGGGVRVTVGGSSEITGAESLAVNETVALVLEEGASLALSCALVDGSKDGALDVGGAGTLAVSAPVTLASGVVVRDGSTLRLASAGDMLSSLTVEKGGVLKLDAIPLSGTPQLTLKSGASLYLPEPTQEGLYKLVDVTATTLAVEDGVLVYDHDGNLLSGGWTQGYYMLSSSQLVWKGEDGARWDLDPENLAWQSLSGEDAAYFDTSVLRFGDVDGASETVVNVGTNVAPKFMLFENDATRYVFKGVDATNSTISLESLVLSAPVTFENAVVVNETLGVAASSAQFAAVEASRLEIAANAEARITDGFGPCIKSLRFEFSLAATASARVAIGELRLFDGSGHFYLPEGTVVTDSAGESMTVTATRQGDEGQGVTGSSGSEKLAALIDGTLANKNKWWPTSGSMTTWVKITFPEPVRGLVGYSLCSADYVPRDPKDWKVYAQRSDGAAEVLLTSVVGQAAPSGRYAWLAADGGGTVFPLHASTLAVRSGGTLVLDGDVAASLLCEDGSVLKASGSSCLRGSGGAFTLQGAVTVDLSEAVSSAACFPILTGYGVTEAQFRAFAVADPSTTTLRLVNGDVYAATAKVMKGPYTATVSGDANFSELVLTDANGDTFTLSDGAIAPDANLALAVAADATLVCDWAGTLGTLTLTGSGSLTVEASPAANDFFLSALDDSAHAGALAWTLPTAAAHVTAGANTTLAGGVAGTGTLAVGAGKRVALGAGVSFDALDIDAAAFVRFAGERQGFVLANLPPATYAFENATLKGSFALPDTTLCVEEGDRVTLADDSTEAGLTLTLDIDVRGGELVLSSASPKVVFTADGESVPAFKMTGGRVVCDSRSTGTGEGLVLGYDSTNGVRLVLAGGVFEVTNSFVNLYQDSSIALSGGAVLRAKGFGATGGSGAISLATADGARTARLEVGSLGFAANAAAVEIEGAGAVVGLEAGASFAGSLVATNGASAVVFGAKEDATLDLSGLSLVRGAASSVVFGEETVEGEEPLTGTVVVGSGLGAWTLASGTVDASAVRTDSTLSLAARPSGGTVKSLVGYKDYMAMATLPLFACGDWADGLDDETLRTFVTPQYEDAKGVATDELNGTLAYADGFIVLTHSLTERTQAITATVTANADFDALAWQDASGDSYTGDFSDVTSATLVLPSGAFTVSVTSDVQIPQVVTRVDGTLTLKSSGGTLKVLESLDDSASTGTTDLPAATLGAGASATTGKSLALTGARSASVLHDTLSIASNSVARILNGTFNGTVEMAFSDSRLVYDGDEPFDAYPHTEGLPGVVEYRRGLTASQLVFGDETVSGSTGAFVLGSGATLNLDTFALGAGASAVQTLTQSSGACVTNTSSETTSFVLGRDAGSASTYNLAGGVLCSADAPLVLGDKGTATLNVSGSGDYKVKGLVSNNDSATLRITGATLKIGADGISLGSSPNTVWNNATIVSTADATISIPKAITMEGPCTFKPEAGTTLTMSSLLTTTSSGTVNRPKVFLEGEGTVLFDFEQTSSNAGDIYSQTGTLRLLRPGILGSTRVGLSAESMLEVGMPLSQAAASGTKYELFRTANISVTVYSGGEISNTNLVYDTVKVYYQGTRTEVPGTLSWEKTSSYSAVYFTPSDAGVTSETLSFDYPVQSETKSFKYRYRPEGAHDGAWATLKNWTAKQRLVFPDGSAETNEVAYSNAKAPGLTGSVYDAFALDGTGEVSCDQLEGWTLRMGLFNGSTATVGKLVKFQSNTATRMFIAVDETSRVTFNGWGAGANQSWPVDFYVSAPSGIVFNVAYNKAAMINYYLAGDGSVTYAKGFSGTHTLKSATIELGDATLTGRAVRRKYLIYGTGATVNTSGAEVAGGTLKSAAPVATDDVGTYAFGTDAVGTYVDFVAYAEPQGVFWTDEESGTRFDITAAFDLDEATGAYSLNAEKSVTLTDASGVEETVPVTPELATIDDDEDVAAAPFALVEGGSVLGVRTIPGLVYSLWRTATLPDGEESEVVRARATSRRTKLKDEARPEGRAFYRVRVEYSP